jgi:hypothetical protein
VADVDQALDEDEVAPAQAAQLAPAQAGVGSGEEDRGVLPILLAQLCSPLQACRVLGRFAVAPLAGNAGEASTSAAESTSKSPERDTGWRSAQAAFAVRP